MPIAKGRRSDAERAAEHCLVHAYGCVVTRRMKRPAGGGAQSSPDGTKQWQAWGGKVDIFHCDVVGKRPDGSHVYAQVTCGKVEAVRQRRRKLETVPWHDSDDVFVFQMVESAAGGNRKDFHFRIHVYSGFKGDWAVADGMIPIPRKWFKALRDDELPEWTGAEKPLPPGLF